MEGFLKSRPVHCVENTAGAKVGLRYRQILSSKQSLHKGTNPKIDSYSAFFDNAKKRSMGLKFFARKHKVEEIYLGSVATDYRVLDLALDAIDLGFKVFILEDACAGIDLHKETSKNPSWPLAPQAATLSALRIFD